jgi:nicotinate-nucleotide adenylyltransferase
MQRIGVFGGTFDPIHFGHLRLAEEMADALGLHEVIFIPAGQPYHRQAPRTDALHRLEMARCAVVGNARFRLDAHEVHSDCPSYTVDTLTRLRAELGEAAPLWLLLGADAFFGLPTWHEWQRLFDLANLAVAARPGAQLSATNLPAPLADAVARRWVTDHCAADAAGAVLWREMTPLAISATAIRNALAEGRSARYLLPDAVLGYIHEHQLYRPHEH